MLRLTFYCFLSLLFTGLVSAQSPKEIWASAAKAYEAGNYNAALEQFRILEDKKPSDDLYFNVGNCYYHLDSVASAVLYYERALKRNPRNSGASENLEMARLKMSEPVIAVDQFFLLSWITAISNILPPLVWGFIFLAALWSLAWLHTKAYRERKSYQLRYKIMAILVLVVIGGIGYFSFNQHNRSDQAVVMVSSELHIAPDPLSQLVKNIEGGEKVLLLDTLEGFYKVRLVNYEVGWIPIGAVKII